MDRLLNRIRAYTWGSRTAIPELLGVPPTGEPQAELWMGAHPGAPSAVDRGTGPRSLADLIAADPEGELGAPVAAEFGPRLPFLLKVLAAEVPLSLQVHPDADRARAGFAAEEALGIPVDAPHRNYRDASHKPELVCALGDFEALCGFREIAGTLKLLDALEVPALHECADVLRGPGEEEALRTAYTRLLALPPDRRRGTVADVASACLRLAADGSPYAEACAAIAGLAARHPDDPGVVAALLLNHLRLRPGEAVYLDAGMPHCYLHGVAVEIIANSDNVLRCGLTDKHIDVPELLRVMTFRPGPAEILTPVPAGPGEEVYRTPAPDFALSRLRPGTGGEPCVLDTAGPQILLCTAGTVTAAGGGTVLALSRGQSVYVPAGGPPVTVTGDGLVFRAAVPGVPPGGPSSATFGR